MCFILSTILSTSFTITLLLLFCVMPNVHFRILFRCFSFCRLRSKPVWTQVGPFLFHHRALPYRVYKMNYKISANGKCAYPGNFHLRVFWRWFCNWENLELLEIPFCNCFWNVFCNWNSKISMFLELDFGIKLNTKSNYKILCFCILFIYKKINKMVYFVIVAGNFL